MMASFRLRGLLQRRSYWKGAVWLSTDTNGKNRHQADIAEQAMLFICRLEGLLSTNGFALVDKDPQ
jgi:hypothetical protein